MKAGAQRLVARRPTARLTGDVGSSRRVGAERTHRVPVVQDVLHAAQRRGAGKHVLQVDAPVHRERGAHFVRIDDQVEQPAGSHGLGRALDRARGIGHVLDHGIGADEIPLAAGGPKPAARSEDSGQAGPASGRIEANRLGPLMRRGFHPGRNAAIDARDGPKSVVAVAVACGPSRWEDFAP